MNKRTISRFGAALASVAFLASLFVSGASAASKYDLAKHVDEFDMQTLGYRIVATSDGGYIVGGKTIACLAYDSSNMPKLQAANSSSNEGEYEFVDLEKCIMAEDAYMPSVYDYCINKLSIPGAGGANPTGADDDDDESEEDAEESEMYYELACMDYMAKYDKNGKGLWMTPVEDDSDVIAVGETNSDYRMLTDYGRIYIFEKANGADDYIRYDGYAYSAKFNADGSLVLADYDGIYLYSKNGNYVRSFEMDYDGYDYTNVIINNNGILASRTDGEKSEVLSISDDLKTIKSRVTAQNDALFAMSMNSNDDIIVARFIIDPESNGAQEILIESFDKDNKKLGQLSYDDEDDANFLFVNNFVATNNMSLIRNSMASGSGAVEEEGTSFIAMYSRDLKETARTTISDSEIVNDVTILRNGTLVTAGGIVNSDNDNGLRIHLAAATSSTPASVKNPETGDNIQLAGIIGGVAALGTALLVGKKFSRR